jgi:putative Mg2+ transporter-C (MgtC) family protein
VARLLGEPFGQGWLQIFDLAVALFLSAIIGLEREVRQKSAGLRTHTVIGFSSALIMLVSKYGFSDVVGRAWSWTRPGWPRRSSPGSGSSAAA